MSWRDSKGRWHGVPEYRGGETRPTPAERKRFRPIRRKRRQMASSKKNG